MSWQIIADRIAKWTAPHSPVMADLVASIRECSADQLAGFMSMHDLAVTATPIPDASPIDVIWVRPQPADDPGSRSVLIEHWAATGWDEQIMRPASRAVSLFWGLAREKWGIERYARSPIMDLSKDRQVPQSAEGEAKVVTLCGSTKFEAEFAEVNQRLTMEGCVVISLGMFGLPDLPDYDWTVDGSDLKGRLAGVHFQKIRMADEVYIVDPGGYLGESTRREIAYAESLGKPVRYLSRE